MLTPSNDLAPEAHRPGIALHRSASYLAMIVTPLVLAACGEHGAASAGAAERARPAAVRVARVIDTTLARPIAAAGTLGPKDEIPLGFKVGGVVARVAVDPGDVVRSGQMLASLDLREIDAALTRARSGAEKADRDLARARRLYADSVVTLAQLQDAETAAEIAHADLQAASFDRSHAVIVAPAAGTVLRRSAEPGQTIAPGAPVLVLGSRTRGNVVEVGITDRDVVRVHAGDRVTARFDALPAREFAGRVTQIAAAADPRTGTYAVEAALDGTDALAAGLVGTVEIHPTSGARVALIPIESVLEGDGNSATVYALSADGRHAGRRRVTVAFVDGSRVAIARGLGGVKAVLTDGAANLDDGAAVVVVP